MTTDQQSVDAFLNNLMEEFSTRVADKLAEAIPNPERLIDVKEAAALLGVTDRHVRNLTARLGGNPPKLASVKVGAGDDGKGTMRIEMAEIRRYIDRNRVASQPADR